MRASWRPQMNLQLRWILCLCRKGLENKSCSTAILFHLFQKSQWLLWHLFFIIVYRFSECIYLSQSQTTWQSERDSAKWVTKLSQLVFWISDCVQIVNLFCYSTASLSVFRTTTWCCCPQASWIRRWNSFFKFQSGQPGSFTFRDRRSRTVISLDAGYFRRCSSGAYAEFFIAWRGGNLTPGQT